MYSCHLFLISCASVRIWPNGYYTRDGIKELRSIGDSYGDDGPLSLNLKRREVKKKKKKRDDGLGIMRNQSI